MGRAVECMERTVGNQREGATWKIRYIDRRMILTWVIQKWIGGPGVD